MLADGRHVLSGSQMGRYGYGISRAASCCASSRTTTVRSPAWPCPMQPPSAVRADDRTLRLWDLLRPVSNCAGSRATRFGFLSVDMLADGRHALSGCLIAPCASGISDGRIAPVRRPPRLGWRWEALGLRAHAVGVGRSILRLWDLETGAELQRFEGHQDVVTSVTVLAEGRRALSGRTIGRCGCGISRPVPSCAASRGRVQIQGQLLTARRDRAGRRAPRTSCGYPITDDRADRS